jgi:hypothetical protein
LTSKPSSSNASITNTTAANPGFIADVAGAYVATMTITDGSNNVASSSVTVTACSASSNSSSPFSGCTSTSGNTGGTDTTSDAALALRRLLNSVATVLAVVVVGM